VVVESEAKRKSMDELHEQIEECHARGDDAAAVALAESVLVQMPVTVCHKMEAAQGWDCRSHSGSSSSTGAD
jgi:hypothetical protein